MGHLIKNTVIRRVLKVLMWTVVVLVSAPALLYVPFVQDFVKDIALKEVAKSSGMVIDVDRFRLKWPLRVSLEGVRVIPAPGDTMVNARSASLNVEMWPLLSLDLRVDGQFEDVSYRLGTPDSAMYLTADVRRFVLNPSSYDLKNSKIDISRAILDGGDVSIVFSGNDTTSTPQDSTASAPLYIKAGYVELRDINYRMSMLPVIDSLGADIPLAVMRDGVVDMATRRIHARSLTVDSVTATYLTPSLEYMKSHPVDAQAPAPAAAPSPDSLMWTITGDSLRLTGRHAVYAMRDAVPQPGLDMNYLQADDIDIQVDSFYNKGVNIVVPLRRLAAVERCGVKLEASGRFSMDTVAMRAERFDISTLFSSIRLNALMGMGDMSSDPALPLRLEGVARIGVPDLELLLPSMAPLLKAVPRYNDITVNMDVDGTAGNLAINRLDAALPGYMSMAVNGKVLDMMSPDNLGGHLNLDGNLANVNFVKPTVLEAKLAKQVNIPPVKLDGYVDMNRGAIAGNLKAVTGEGSVLLDADWNGRAESYDVEMAMRSFPVSSFLPEMGIGDITADAKVSGHGYSPFSRTTSVDAVIDVTSAEYQKVTYSDIRLWAALDTGYVDAGVLSMNHDANFDLSVTGNIADDDYRMDFEGDVRNLDLKALNLSPTESRGSFSLAGSGHFRPGVSCYNARMTIGDLEWKMPELTLGTPGIEASVDATDSSTVVSVDNESLHAEFIAGCPVDTLAGRFAAAMAVLDREILGRRIYVDSIQRELPRFMLSVNSGANSLISDFLAPSETSFRKMSLSVNNDSLFRLAGAVTGIKAGDTRIDSVDISAMQHGKFLLYRANMNNRPGTFDSFAHVDVTGFLADQNLSLFLNQSNIKGDAGFKLGFNVTAVDSLLTLRMTPLDPVIGYKNWTLNKDNMVSYNMETRHIDANLELANGDSHFKIYTEHEGHGDASQEDVIVSASGIQLADWLALSPFAPPVKGIAGADIRLGWDAETKSIEGNGAVSLDDFTYGNDRVGSFLLDVGLTTNTSGVVKASTSLVVDSVKVITAVGALNDSTASNPFMLDFSMIHFPLRIVNPFLPPGVAKLSGMLNGRMDITGTMTSPVFNGYLDFDSTAVAVDMIGSAFRFSEEKIPVDSNVVKFDRYTISGLNENPMYIDGTVDINNIVSPKVALNMKARNMQVIGSKRGKGNDIYGRGYIDLDADVNGNMSFMRVDATLNLLEGSNVTYVMNTVADQLTAGVADDDMVHFVQFSDTAAVLDADTIPAGDLALMLDARLIVSQGTTINVDISANGQDKASIQGSGNLTFHMSPFSDMSLTGRYNIEKGFVRYTPPFMSQKNFDFESGSYIAFNGDVLNPILNLHAYDTMKANVTESGQNSRLINFIVSLNVTNTLSNMDVAFDLATNDDITIQNELETMSPEQRANQAMNLLLYNVYTGPGTKASSNLSGNPLFSFLTARLNSWAANTIKGVDISFGIDQYDRTYDGATSTTTSYSYKVSKSLFNDRFKIVVGGNYSTDSNMDENFSQNLINDISFEYMLNRSGSMYVRLFRHVGYESILEGEVIQTGAGFVYKRKLSSLRDLFRFGRRPEEPTVTLPAETEQVNTNADGDDTKK